MVVHLLDILSRHDQYLAGQDAYFAMLFDTFLLTVFNNAFHPAIG
jgi:hypothetical protein